MSKFIKITIDKNKKIFKNIEYIPCVISLYKRFSRFLHDDYFNQKDCDCIDTVIKLIERTSPYFWVILDSKSNRFSGFIFLENWSGSFDNPHSAEVTTCFHPAFWGHYTKVCSKKFINYCFKKYKLKKLKAIVFKENFKVKTLLKHCGLKKEATLKAETLKNEKLQDIEIYSIFNNKTKKEGTNNEL